MVHSLLRSLAPLLLCTILAACTWLRVPGSQPGAEPQTLPTGAVVLPQPALAGPSVYPSSNPLTQIVEVRIDHVRDLSQILVQVGEDIEVGQVLARLEGYAREVSLDVRLAEEQLAEARARLAKARGDLTRVRQEAASEQERAVAKAVARVTSLERRVEALGRQKEIADARLAMAQAKTAHRKRWLEILQPLGQFDPWGDLPYLVGTRSGPQGKRSDLAYREALAQAKYDLRMAELEETIAELEAADAAAELEGARQDLETAWAALEQAQKAFIPLTDGTLRSLEFSVRIGELRLAQARAELEKTVIKSLVAGRVLAVRVHRVNGNEAVVVIRIAAQR